MQKEGLVYNKNMNSDKNIYKILFGLVSGIAAFFALSYFSVRDTSSANTQDQIDTLNKEVAADRIIWQNAIVRTDERLKNLEQRFGVQNVKSSSFVEQLKKEISLPTATIK